jgi:hypothetical protein
MGSHYTAVPTDLEDLTRRVRIVAERERHERPTAAQLFDSWLRILEQRGQTMSADEVRLMDEVLTAMGAPPAQP